MDANKIETMKARALAAIPGPWFASAGEVPHVGRVECVTDDLRGGRARFIAGAEGDAESRANCRFVAAANPAAVLELIAEVERLRAELAAGAACEGGNTSESAGLLDHANTTETRMNSGFEGGHLGAAPAAGTVEKDAARFQLAIALEDNAEFLYAAVLNHVPDATAIRADFDAAMAHTKGKDAT